MIMEEIQHSFRTTILNNTTLIAGTSNELLGTPADKKDKYNFYPPNIERVASPTIDGNQKLLLPKTPAMRT